MAPARWLAAALASALLLTPATATGTPSPTAPPSPNAAGHDSITASTDAAQRNAHLIFNAVSNVMRQWGSSIQHNGLSFFPLTVPTGSIFYHGAQSPDRPPAHEWLAFEPEHAEMFARSFEGGYVPRRFLPPGWPGGDTGRNDSPGDQQQRDCSTSWLNRMGEPPLQYPTTQTTNGDDDPPVYIPPKRGYFHTYRATRPLRLVSIDGMSAGKADFGPVDSQDLVLLVDHPRPSQPVDPLGPYDIERGKALCDLARTERWGRGLVDGFVRAEAGFEIIYCNFAEGAGLDLYSVMRRPFANESKIWAHATTGNLPEEAPHSFQSVLSGNIADRGDKPKRPGLPRAAGGSVALYFEWIRAASQRYFGFPAGRFEVDFSHAVSALWYDLDISNPDKDPRRSRLPRLIRAAEADRRSLSKEVAATVTRAWNKTEDGGAPKRSFSSLETPLPWQGLADAVTTRYATRLRDLAAGDGEGEEATPPARMKAMIESLVLQYVSYETRALAEGVGKCARHYIDSYIGEMSGGSTESDDMLLQAFTTVTTDICRTLFEARTLVARGNETSTEDEVRARTAMRDLKERLDWPIWKYHACGTCPVDEVCFTAMFPAGTNEDHFEPQCKDANGVADSLGYWWDG